MINLNISIKLDDSTLEDDGLAYELHNILSSIQYKIATGQKQNKVYDSNGNNVATFKIVEEEKTDTQKFLEEHFQLIRIGF